MRQLRIPTFLLFALCLLSIPLHHYIGLNPDNVVLLKYAQQLLAGNSYLTDFTDTNPPLVIYIYTIPTILSQILNIPIKFSLDLITTLYIAISLYTCNNLLKQSEKYHKTQPRLFIISILATSLFIIPFIFAVDLITAIAFSDRIHLLLIFTLPYLLLNSPSLSNIKISNKQTHIISIFAAIGFCIKPHYSIIWFTANLHWAIKNKQFVKTFFNPGNITIYCIAIIYITAIITIYPNYLNNIIPILIATYDKISSPLTHKLLLTLPIIFIILIPLYLYRQILSSTYKNKLAFRPDITYILCLILTAIIHIIISGGWYYTYYLLYAFNFYLLTLLCCDFFQLKHKNITTTLQKRCNDGIYSSIFIAILLTSYHISTATIFLESQQNNGDPYQTKQPLAKHLTNYLTTNSQSNLFVQLSITGPWSSLIAPPNTQYMAAQRYDFLWMIPGLYEEKTNDTSKIDAFNDIATDKKWIWHHVTNNIAKDFQKQPEIVFIDTSRIHRGLNIRQFNILEFLTANPQFAKIWQNYKYKTTIDICKKHNRNHSCKTDIYHHNPPTPHQTKNYDANSKNKLPNTTTTRTSPALPPSS